MAFEEKLTGSCSQTPVSPDAWPLPSRYRRERPSRRDHRTRSARLVARRCARLVRPPREQRAARSPWPERGHIGRCAAWASAVAHAGRGAGRFIVDLLNGVQRDMDDEAADADPRVAACRRKAATGTSGYHPKRTDDDLRLASPPDPLEAIDTGSDSDGPDDAADGSDDLRGPNDNPADPS